MKCKKLILHIGAHKTGTTAIQTFIYENREALNKQGFYMPDFLFCEEHKPAELRYSIINKDENRTRAYLRDIVGRAKERSCETVIISDEDFCETNKDDLNNVKIFSEFFEQIDVLMYCRRPDRQSESAYAFCVMWKTTKYSGSPEKWFMEHPGKDYYGHARYYQQAILGCTIKLVSYDFNAHNLIGSFVEVCGMKEINYSLPKKDSSNISANKYMVEVMNQINKYRVTDKLFLEIKNYILNHEDLQTGPKALFFSNEQRRLNERLLENKTSKLIDDFHGGEPLFDEVKPIQVPEGLDGEIKKRIVDEIVNKYNLEGQKQPASIVRFKNILKPAELIATADIYREIALICDDLGLAHTAYRFMKLAQINRPEGPTIRKKLADLKEKRQIDSEAGKGNYRQRYLEALFVEQTFSNETKAEEIRATLLKTLQISSRVKTFELLRELALFCECYNEIEAAYLFMQMAKNRNPIGKMIGNKCALYVQMLGTNKNKKRPTVYLHMGANKTASTSIQCTLASNREALKNTGDGYLFSKAGGANKTRAIRYLCLKNDSNLKHRLKSMFGDESVLAYNHEILDGLNAELKGFEGQNYIFSGEDLFQLNRKTMNRMRELLELLIPNCEIKVIFVIRKYLSYMNSGTQQAAKGGRIEKEVLKTRHKNGQFFHQAISNIRNIFGSENLTLYTFEESLQNNRGPVGFFLEQIGLQEQMIDVLDIKRKNESLSNRATKMIFWMNEKNAKLGGPSSPENKNIRKFNKLFQSISGNDRYTLDKKTIKKFYPIMKKEAIWLKHEFGIDYMDYKKKEADAPVVFEEVFMREMMDLYETIGPAKKHIVYRVFVDRSKSWRMDKKSRSTFASLAKWCENTYPQITDKNYLKTLDRRVV